MKAIFVRLLGRLKPALPRSLWHRIELMRQQVVHPLEPELASLHLVFDMFRIKGELAVDIGANHGIWALELCKRFNSVIAIEPNPRIAAGLRKVVPRNCTVLECGVSSAPGRLQLHVPMVGGKELSGWASFESANCPDADSLMQVDVAVRTLDAILESMAPDFIKIDVEGHEFEVIVGARKSLERARPILMIEVKQKDEARVSRLLGELEYEPRSLSELCGVAGTLENKFFVPREILSKVGRGYVGDSLV